MELIKYKNNPILKKNKNNYWENLCVLNPAVIYNEKDKLFYMIYRAAGNDKTHYIYLGLATSKDGFNFKRMSNKPLLAPSKDSIDGGGIEDPRIIKMGDYYYLTYASRPFAPGQYWKKNKITYGFKPEFGPKCLLNNDTLTHLAISKDLKNWTRLGRITDARDDDRDVIIFPEKINGKFVKFSRPMNKCGKGFKNNNPAIWISSSDDILQWNDDAKLFYKGIEKWEDLKVGGSTPPLKTKKGWLFFYHGVSKKDNEYRVGAMLLDLKDPSKIIAKTKEFLMEPEKSYETNGFYNGCVFPTANVIKDGIIYIYYGAGDKCICVATIKEDELIKHLLDNCKFKNNK